jgi:hypothetical protein
MVILNTSSWANGRTLVSMPLGPRGRQPLVHATHHAKQAVAV